MNQFIGPYGATRSSRGGRGWSKRAVTVTCGLSAATHAALLWAADEAARRGAPLVVTAPEDGRPQDEAVAFATALATVRERAPRVEVHALGHHDAGHARDDPHMEIGLQVIPAGPAAAATAADACHPVAVVPDPGAASPGPVVLAVAPWTAEHVIEYGFCEAAARSAPLHAVRVCLASTVPLAGPQVAPGTTDDAVIGRASRELSGALNAWAELHPDVPVRLSVIQDEPSAGLLALTHIAELLVLGRSVRGLGQGARLRSPLGTVLGDARCPVLVIPGDLPSRAAIATPRSSAPRERLSDLLEPEQRWEDDGGSLRPE